MSTYLVKCKSTVAEICEVSIEASSAKQAELTIMDELLDMTILQRDDCEWEYLDSEVQILSAEAVA